ncbi:MAG: hypothetical protein ACLQLH_12460 [Terracidiphilus sp.]
MTNHESVEVGAKIIDFLEYHKYSALALVVFSIPVFGILAFGTIMFCDSPGPVPTCMKVSAIFLIIPVVQIVSYAIAWMLLEMRKHIRVSAGLMVLSVLPILSLIIGICLRAIFAHHSGIRGAH